MKTPCATYPGRYIVDLDDFHEKNTAWNLLSAIKAEVPQFKVTLFTIPGRCSPQFVRMMREVDWLDLVPHGWMHQTSMECLQWTADEMSTCLDDAEALGFTTRGFKAPGWQISDACYQVLHDRGYWVADKEYNNLRRPRGMLCYLLDSPYKVHGHIGSTMGNDLSRICTHLSTLRDASFGFVRDHLIVWE